MFGGYYKKEIALKDKFEQLTANNERLQIEADVF